MNRYYLFRDRKALFTAPVGIFGYFVVIQVLGYLAVSFLWPQVVSLPPLIDEPWVWTVVCINFLFLVNRILHRAWFTASNHGIKHAALAPFRIIVSNLISFGAFMRAVRQYVSHLITRRPIAWDKTQHSYPSLSELQQGAGRLGDTLRFWNHLSEDDLNRALAEQKNRYRPLGLLLLDLSMVDDEALAEAFAERAETYASTFDPFQIDPQVLSLLTQHEAAGFGAVPLRLAKGSADVAMAEPLAPAERIELERLLGRRGVRSVRFLFAPLSDIAFALRFAWSEDPFTGIRKDLERMRAAGGIDASHEAQLWRSVRAGYVRMGDLLVRNGTISHADLQTALASARTTGARLGEALVAAGLADSDAIEAVLRTQRSATWIQERLAAGMAVPPDAPLASYVSQLTPEPTE